MCCSDRLTRFEQAVESGLLEMTIRSQSIDWPSLFHESKTGAIHPAPFLVQIASKKVPRQFIQYRTDADDFHKRRVPNAFDGCDDGAPGNTQRAGQQRGKLGEDVIRGNDLSALPAGVAVKARGDRMPWLTGIQQLPHPELSAKMSDIARTLAQRLPPKVLVVLLNPVGLRFGR